MTTEILVQEVFVVKYGNGKKDFVATENLMDASIICRTYISSKNFGASQWRGGEVFNANGKRVATVSYNGRIWDMNNKELK